MDEVRLKDELMARLSNELDRPALQVIDGALSSVLRNYEVAKRETGLSTNIISFPELDIFIGKMRFENYSASTVNQYQRFLTDLLAYVGKPVQEIQDSDIVECLNYYEQVRQISASTKDHKRRIASSFFAFLHDRGYIRRNPMATVDPIKYIAEVREALSAREMEKMRIACGTDIRDNTVLSCSWRQDAASARWWVCMLRISTLWLVASRSWEKARKRGLYFFRSVLWNIWSSIWEAEKREPSYFPGGPHIRG